MNWKHCIQYKSEVGDISNEQHPRFVDLMYTIQEAYSGVGCEVLCGVLQIVGESVAWQCRAWSYSHLVLQNIQSEWPGPSLRSGL